MPCGALRRGGTGNGECDGPTEPVDPNPGGLSAMAAAHGRSLGLPRFEAVGRMAGCVWVRRFWCPSSAPVIRPTACRHPTGGRPAPRRCRVPPRSWAGPRVRGGGDLAHPIRHNGDVYGGGWGARRCRVPFIPRACGWRHGRTFGPSSDNSRGGRTVPSECVRTDIACAPRFAVRRRAAVAFLPQASHIVFRHHAPFHDRRDVLGRSQRCPRPGRRCASGDVARERPRVPDDPVRSRYEHRGPRSKWFPHETITSLPRRIYGDPITCVWVTDTIMFSNLIATSLGMRYLAERNNRFETSHGRTA